MSDLCTERVDRSGSSRWSNFQDCGRPAVEDGLCKLHLRVRENRRAKDRAWDAKQRFGREVVAEAEALGNRLGIKVLADYSWSRAGYTGDFIVPADWLRAQA